MTTPILLRNDLTRIVLGVLLIGVLIAGSFWILKPFLPALIWATMIVVATWPLMRRAQALLFGRRSLAVALMTIAFLLLVAVPIGYGVSAVVDYAPDLVARIKETDSIKIPAPPDWVAGLPIVGERLAREWQDAAVRGPAPLIARVTPYAREIGTWLLSEAGGAGLFVVQLALTLLFMPILYASGEAAANGVRRFVVRLAGDRGDRTIDLAAQAIRAVALGIIVTALVQSALGGIGLAVTGVPYAVAFAALMFVLCIAQLGPMLVLFPAVGWLYWMDANVAATVLLVWTLVVGSLDNVLRPVLIRRGADLPMLLIMAGVIGGLLAFGLIGLFVGPVLLAVSFRLLQAWVDDGLIAAAPDKEAAPAPDVGP